MADYKHAKHSAVSAESGFEGSKRLSGGGSGSTSNSLGEDALPYSRDRWRRPPATCSSAGAAPLPTGAYRDYSRATAGERYRSMRRPSRGRRIAAVALAVFLCAVLAAGAAFALYMHRIDEAIRLHDSDAMNLLGTTPSGPYYTLIIGSDTRSVDQYEVGANEDIDGERADVMVLARIDEQNRQVTLLSIPRDTPWTSDDGTIHKLNESYYYGPAEVIKAIEGIAGVDITHYARLRFTGFEGLVDALGGVYVDVPVAVSRWDAMTKEEVSVEAGPQVLDGQHALIFARARHEYDDDQDQARQGSVRTLIEAIVDKVKEAPISSLPGLVLELSQYIGTDMSSYDLLRLAVSFQGDTTFYGTTAPYKGDIDDAADGQWLCYDDREGWSRVMEVIDSGADPSTVSYEGDVAYIAGTEETVVVE